MLKILRCKASYGSYKVFHPFSLEISPGETITLAGPSGCGKSTFLNLLAGLKQPDSGTLELNNQRITTGNLHTALILQDYGLFPWFTVLENVALGLKIRGMEKGKRLSRARLEIEKVGLSGLEKRYPGELSGGQRQRVALARSLSLDPELLLMDEPFSALDAVTRESLQELLGQILSAGNIITLLVTHSIEEAVFLGKRIFLMSRGPESRLYEYQGMAGERDKDFRKDPAYFSLCSLLRERMEEIS